MSGLPVCFVRAFSLPRTCLPRMGRPRCLSAQHRFFSDFTGPPPTEPVAGAFRGPSRVLKEEIKYMKILDSSEQIVPRETDIAIIGGGLVGLMTAYFLKQRFPRGYAVTLIEKDPTCSQSASVWAIGGLRQQFSLPENIQMSQFSADFFRTISEHLSILDMDPPDIQFSPQGYLRLASQDDSQSMEEDHETQTSLGVNADLLRSSELKEKFPWLRVDDIAVGSYGLEKEGWFDPWLLLAAVKAKAASLGVQFVTGDLVGFGSSTNIVQAIPGTSFQKRKSLVHAHVQTEDDRVHPIQFAVCINCAGPQSRDVARLASIGTGEEALQFDLPVMSRIRYIYLFHCPPGPGLEMPMLVDPSGIFVRREGLGGHFVCGASPPLDENYQLAGPEAATEYFEQVVRPQLTRRIPVFEQLELVKSWTGCYEYSYFDQSLVVGNHPYHRNFLMASGASGLGALHAPALGRALTEFLLDDDFSTIDLSRMNFDRILDDEPLVERLAL